MLAGWLSCSRRGVAVLVCTCSWWLGGSGRARQPALGCCWCSCVSLHWGACWWRVQWAYCCPELGLAWVAHLALLPAAAWLRQRSACASGRCGLLGGWFTSTSCEAAAGLGVPCALNTAGWQHTSTGPGACCSQLVVAAPAASPAAPCACCLGLSSAAGWGQLGWVLARRAMRGLPEGHIVMVGLPCCACYRVKGQPVLKGCSVLGVCSHHSSAVWHCRCGYVANLLPGLLHAASSSELAAAAAWSCV